MKYQNHDYDDDGANDSDDGGRDEIDLLKFLWWIDSKSQGGDCLLVGDGVVRQFLGLGKDA